MNALRQYFLRHRWLGGWVVASALLMRLLVPAGFMPVFSGAGVTIEVCTGFGPQKMTMAMPGMPDHGQDKSDHDSKAMPCGFGGLAFSSLAATDPIVLALAIAFLVATVFRARIHRVAPAVDHLRPPLRGPPILS